MAARRAADERLDVRIHFTEAVPYVAYGVLEKDTVIFHEVLYEVVTAVFDTGEISKMKTRVLA